VRHVTVVFRSASRDREDELNEWYSETHTPGGRLESGHDNPFLAIVGV
jgi:hypothetical protein